MEIKRCMNCMEELSENSGICPACGTDNRQVEQIAYALRCSSVLHERYLIGRVLGQGGFGITYIGMDMLLNIKVAIKEYFPMGMVARDPGNSSKLLWNPSQVSQSQRQSGYDSFLKEARKMARIDEIPSIVRVRDLFLENETAYIVMDFVEGITLKQKLSQEGPMAFSECFALLHPMMEDLAKVHKQGMIHRDISPDNIMIRKDGKVRLLDLGAAKDMTTAHGVSSQVVAKKGFSPFEQYRSGGEVGPWTDVYALCATIYYCITGKLLPEAFDRIDEEEINFPDSLKETLSEEKKEALRAGLEVRVKKRIQSVEELLRQLDTELLGEKVLSVNQEERQRQNPQLISNFKQEEEIEKVPIDKTGSPSKASKVKKGVWVALAVCLVVVAVFIYTSSGSEPEEPSEPMAKIEETPSLMMEDANEGVKGIENYTVLGSDIKRWQIRSITFQSTLKDRPEDAWDVSEKQDGTVMAWVSPDENDKYELYIGGEGGIQAPISCHRMFAFYFNVKEIKFNGCFDTSQVTDMKAMFYGCERLKQLDVSSFDTSQVTNMGDMFYGCKKLEQLDVSSFDTSQVTNMQYMFSGCKSLKRLDSSADIWYQWWRERN